MIRIQNISGLELPISPQSVLKKVHMQFSQNQKLKDWFNDLLSKKDKSSGKVSIDDILTGKIVVEVNIFSKPGCLLQSQGQTKWVGVFTGGWKGQKDRTIGLGSCRFQTSWLSTDSSDENTAAELIIHELAHWVEAYALGHVWPNRPKGIGYDTGDYVVKVFVRW